MNSVVRVTVVFLVICFLGCDNKLSDPVSLNASVKVDSNRHVSVTGETNLPTGTNLYARVENQFTGKYAQVSLVVNKGKFSTGPFGPQEGLVKGEYELVVVMSVASSQPETVKQIIGNDGEYLTGPNVENATFGKIVKISNRFSYGSEEDIKLENNLYLKKNKTYLEKLAGLRNELKRLVSEGQKMESCRHATTDKPDLMRDCFAKMKKNQSAVKKLQLQIKSLPKNHFELNMAASMTYDCVSCSKSAIGSCKKALVDLAKSEKKDRGNIL